MGHIHYDAVHFATKAIHAGQHPDETHGALATPIFQTSTFCFETAEEGGAKFGKEIPGYVYTRSGNPTTRALEEKLAAIEECEDGVATASGLGAIGSALLAFLQCGDHIICGNPVYGGTSVIMRTNLPRLGIEVTFVDATDPAAIEGAIRANTKVIYVESLSNPTIVLADIEKIGAIGKKHGIKTMVDNTFTPPPMLFPKRLGIDIVLHSLTKYINGHGDALGGVVLGSTADMQLVKGLGVTKICGTPPAPFNSYLILRGMKTLDLRVRKHCENAMKVALYLEKNPNIKHVFYPGLPSNPQHELVAHLMQEGLYSGMISFELQDNIHGLSSLEAGKKLLNALTIPAIAVSLGDPDTLIEHPASMTHANVPPAERVAAGITDGLIRLSVGLEDDRDLIQDFETAFASL